MRDALVAAPVRTPIGTFGGALAPLTADRLAAHVVKAVLARSGVPAEALDEVIIAQSYASSEAPCIGRYAPLLAGLPVEIPGFSLDRRCGSGLQAVLNAAMMVQTGAADAVLVGGVESMSNIEYYTTASRWGSRLGNTVLYDRLDRGRERSQPPERFGQTSGVIELVEAVAVEYGISRAAADEYAMASHARAAEARDSGKFKDEIEPIEVPGKRGASTLVSEDQGIREGLTPEGLAALRPIIKGGAITAGNASQQSDAAAACLVISPAFAERYGLKPMARLAGWAAAGCDPLRFGMGPVPAVGKLLRQTGLTLEQMDLIEINEAFAAQVICVLREWGIDSDRRVNVSGSGLSLGHPIGATGVRILTSMLFEMDRRDARFGLETICIGGGQGLAAVFERLAA